MDKEIKYLLEEIKNNTYDYVGTNGCLYQDLSREELNLLLNYINNLEQQCKKQKEVIDRIEKYIEKETRIYGLSMSIELGTHFDNILGILKEVE